MAALQTVYVFGTKICGSVEAHQNVLRNEYHYTH